MKRSIGILKNHQKHCNVLQKSRFGWTAIDGNMSLEGRLGPVLTLSWLLRVQVGAKLGKLTLLGGLRGSNLDLKGALEVPEEAPRESKRAKKGHGSSSDIECPFPH